MRIQINEKDGHLEAFLAHEGKSFLIGRREIPLTTKDARDLLNHAMDVIVSHAPAEERGALLSKLGHRVQKHIGKE